MKELALIFPGQGSQKIGMGKEIYDAFPIAKEVFQEVDEALKQNLTDLILNGEIAELTKTENTQPALMCVSLAIWKVIESESKKSITEIAKYVAGHSLGEYSALAAANALSITDAAKILKIRGLAMAEAGAKTKGAMAAVLGLDTETTEKLAKQAAGDEICQIANDNCVGQIVISGSEAAIDRAVSLAKEYGAKRVMKLPVSGAFHSELIRQAEEKLQAGLNDIKISAPQIPLIGNVTVTPTTDPELIKSNLVTQLTSVVRWRETLEFFHKNNILEIAEIGSGNVLCGLAKRTSKDFICNAIETTEQLENFLKDIA